MDSDVMDTQIHALGKRMTRFVQYCSEGMRLERALDVRSHRRNLHIMTQQPSSLAIPSHSPDYQQL